MKRNRPLSKALFTSVLLFCLLAVLHMMDMDPLYPLIAPWWVLSTRDSIFSLWATAALLLSLLAGFLVWLLATVKELRFTLSALKAKLAALENTQQKD